MCGHVLLVCCVLIAGVQATVQEDLNKARLDQDTTMVSGPAVPCPSLNANSIKFICETPNKSPAPCTTDSKTGTRAHLVWTKKTGQDTPSVPSALMCNSSGVWTRDTVKNGKLSVPAQYKNLYDGRYYKFIPDPLSWDVALMLCMNDGGHLVVIDSQQELDAITKYVKEEYKAVQSAKNNGIHVGLHDRLEDGKFQTLFGAPLNVSTGISWGKNEPGKGGTGLVEDCVFLDALDNTLHDIKCDTAKYPFVCEIPLE